MNTDFDTQILVAYNEVKPFALFLTKNEDTANDLLQDAIAKAYAYKHRFEVGTNAKAWLSTILKHTFLDYYTNIGRSEKKKSIVFYTNTISESQLNNRAAYNQALSDLELEEIANCINQVDDKLTTPFLLYQRGFKYDEIAERLNIPLGTVKNRIHKAKQELQHLLKKIGYNINDY